MTSPNTRSGLKKAELVFLPYPHQARPDSMTYIIHVSTARLSGQETGQLGCSFCSKWIVYLSSFLFHRIRFLELEDGVCRNVLDSIKLTPNYDCYN